MTTTMFQAKATQVAAHTGDDFNIDGIKKNWTVYLRVTQISGTARFSFPDTVNNWGASIPGPAFCIVGDTSLNAQGIPDSPIVKSFSSRDWPALRFGTANAELRCNLDELVADAGGAITCTYEAWCVYD